MKMILLDGWVRRNSTKDCVDTSVEISGIINSVIQKTKRLTFGATLIASLVNERDLLLMEFSLLNSNFFFKFESARNSIRSRENPIYLAHAQEGGLSRLQDVDEDELLKAIQRLPNKQCASDPIPTWFLKKISRMISPFAKSMVNQSFSEGIVPKSWNSAQVTPLLKKPSLDHNFASSYRPISYLPVLSKLSERLVLNRVMSYLNNSNLLPTHQSAYRRHLSTETAVPKVYSDIFEF